MAFFLFVPGGRRTGEDWDRVRAILDGRGDLSRAITLSDPQHATLDGHISEVLEVVEDIPRERPIILVGHSYAGFVITGVADKAQERLAGLVFVDSAVPRNNQPLMRVFSSAGVDPARFGVPSWPPFTQPLAFDEAIFNRIPKTYIHCLRSQFLELTAAIPAYVRSRPPAQHWRYLEMDADHYCMLNQPEELARLLLPA